MPSILCIELNFCFWSLKASSLAICFGSTKVDLCCLFGTFLDLIYSIGSSPLSFSSGVVWLDSVIILLLKWSFSSSLISVWRVMKFWFFPLALRYSVFLLDSFRDSVKFRPIDWRLRKKDLLIFSIYSSVSSRIADGFSFTLNLMASAV